MIAKSHSKMPIHGGDLKSGWKRLTTGKKDYTTSSKQVLDKFGDRTISAIMLKRTPISVTAIIKTFDLIKDKPYDDLFHLYMVVTFTDGKKIVCEKNQVINLSKTIPKSKKDTEQMPIVVRAGLTLNEMLNNARNDMGETKYFSYDAIKNNCQNYVLTLITSSGMATADSTSFIKQDVTNIFGKFAQKGINAITNTSGTLSTFVN